MQCQIARVYDFTPNVRFSCAALCRQGSEMQQEFIKGTDTTVSIVHLNWQPAAWAATHVWREMQTLEGFTHRQHRRRGLQRFAACGLIAAGLLDTSKPVAVFSPDCVGLTRSLGFVDVKLFRRSDSGDWVPL